jgi:hypothetical protein
MPKISVVQAVLGAYGVKGVKVEGAVHSLKSRSAEVSDDAVLKDLAAESEEEQRFLEKHVAILKMAGVDRVKQRGFILFYLVRKMPLVLRLLVGCMFAFGMLILALPAIYMLFSVIGSKVAMAKLLLLLLFVLLIMGLQMMIGV